MTIPASLLVTTPLTLLYVPADQPDRVAKALASAADVVIIDLEDAVTPERKELARGLSRMVESIGDRQVQVRVNAANTPWSAADQAIVAKLPAGVGVRLPKMVDPDQVCRIADRLGGRRLLLIESALGVERAFALATAHPLVATISLGEADLRSDLGLTSDRGLLWARSRIVNAARAAGLPAPTMSVYANVSDLVGLASSCAEGRELGFLGRTAIHPGQLETIAASFRPTAAEVTAARAVLAALASATESQRRTRVGGWVLSRHRHGRGRAQDPGAGRLLDHGERDGIALVEAMEDRAMGMNEEDRAFRDFAELSAEWFWEQDTEFRFSRMFGVSPEKLLRNQSDFIGKRRWDMPISGFTPQQLAEHKATYERHEPFHDFEYMTEGFGGALQHYSVSGGPAFNDEGEFVGYHGIARNVTRLRLAEQAIRESERQLSQIVDASPMPTFVIDAEHRVTHWNRACEKLTGFNRRDMLGQADAWRAFYPAPRPLMADLVVSGSKEDVIGEHLQNFGHSTLIADAIEAEGFFPHMGEGGRWLHSTAAPLRDSESRLTGAIETLQDITDQRKAQFALERLASRDGLTGIANRRCFDEKVSLEWKRTSRDVQCMSLLMLDIDHFKAYNDTYGHPAGDRCLQQIAIALEQLLFRPNDTVARYGGEEFAVILPGSDAEGAAIVASRILDRVAELAIPHSSEEGGGVTISIGVATSQTRSDMSLEGLISSADKALYKAKEGGRNRFVADHPAD